MDWIHFSIIIQSVDRIAQWEIIRSQLVSYTLSSGYRMNMNIISNIEYEYAF